MKSMKEGCDKEEEWLKAMKLCVCVCVCVCVCAGLVIIATNERSMSFPEGEHLGKIEKEDFFFFKMTTDSLPS